MRRRLWSYPWIPALVYLVLGGLWILVSDRVVAGLSGSQARARAWQFWNGWVFVGATALVLFLLARAFLRSVRATRGALARVLDLLPDPAVVRRAADDAYLVANRAFRRDLGRKRGEVEGWTPRSSDSRSIRRTGRSTDGRLEAEGEVRDFPLHITLPDGTRRTWLTSSAREELDGAAMVVATTKDVTELERERVHAENQVRRIQALRQIDLAITASLELAVTLDVVLQQVVEHLSVDAAAILMWSDASQKLEFAASRGFRTSALRHTALALGEGYAGQVARDRTTRVVQDLAAAPGASRDRRCWPTRTFASYAATPLVAKGRVNGVLELFGRAPLAGAGRVARLPGGAGRTGRHRHRLGPSVPGPPGHQPPPARGLWLHDRGLGAGPHPAGRRDLGPHRARDRGHPAPGAPPGDGRRRSWCTSAAARSCTTSGRWACRTPSSSSPVPWTTTSGR